MLDLNAQLIPAPAALSWYSNFTVFLVYFIVACANGYICGKLAEIGGMSVTGFVFLGSFTTTFGLTVAFFKGVNPYYGLLFGLVGLGITVVVFITSRTREEAIDLPQTPAYSPFDTPIGYDDGHMDQLYAPNQPPPEEYANGSMMCPSCNVSVPLEYSICWNCGEMLRRQSISRLCPTCHTEMPADADVCDNCGCSLDGPTFFK